MSNIALIKPLISDLINTSGTTGMTYNPQEHLFLSAGYTSGAGNTYHSGAWVSSKILLVVDIGHGYALSFVNGIKIYTAEKQLIVSQAYHCQEYNKSFIQEESNRMLKASMIRTLQNEGLSFSKDLLNARVSDLLREAFDGSGLPGFVENARLQ